MAPVSGEVGVAQHKATTSGRTHRTKDESHKTKRGRGRAVGLGGSAGHEDEARGQNKPHRARRQLDDDGGNGGQAVGRRFDGQRPHLLGAAMAVARAAGRRPQRHRGRREWPPC